MALNVSLQLPAGVRMCASDACYPRQHGGFPSFRRFGFCAAAPAPAPATTGEGGGKVWWPWTAWDSVLQRVRKGMIADEAERRKKSQLKEENKED